MHGYLGSYATLGVLLIAAVVVFAGAFGANKLLSPWSPATPAGKFDTYECGVDPVGGEWAQAQIRYYIYAFLYVLFAVESVFLFPWAVIYARPEFRTSSVIEMAVFLAVLSLGLVYAWRKRVLRWV
jgi:NADH-quinone oxidoreductase subunit A